jgi:arylsulfatase A-like enzyme
MTRRPCAGIPRVVLLLAGLLAAAGCARAPRPSAVLITIDTLRADHLGCYGYAPPTSPHIDALARQGMVFRQARTTLPRTTQSIASILTGRLPKTHGARGLFAHLPEANLTVAEALRQAGYSTAAVVSNTFLRRGQGFEQGFDSYDNPESRWDADSAGAVSDAAIAWLDRAPHDRPFFLWVHYLDPHWRYEPDPSWADTFDPSFSEPFTVYQDLDAHRYTKGRMIFDPPLTPRQEQHVRALYDGEIAQTDAAVGRLLDRLDHLDSRLVVVLTSDHGESLGEHGYHFAHGEYLYEQGLRVPLVIRFPGAVEAGSVNDGMALNIDVAPTMLALLGVSRLQGVEGRPLLVPAAGTAAVAGGASGAPGFTAADGRPFSWAESDFQLIHPENPRYFIRGPRGRWSSACDGRYKLIHIPAPGREMLELYDLRDDPGESRNLVDDPAYEEVRRKLLHEVTRFADYGTGAGDVAAPKGGEAGPEALSPEEEERLRSLGYIN